ncbi:MAG: hypothetical protein LBU24_02425 [Methanocalculaceae archaeon]|nr:hypothetical protein [Methanocalculaceae archaeon]
MIFIVLVIGIFASTTTMAIPGASSAVFRPSKLVTVTPLVHIARHGTKCCGDDRKHHCPI